VQEARALGSSLEIIDRCNLTVLCEPGQEDLPRFLADNRWVTLLARGELLVQFLCLHSTMPVVGVCLLCVVRARPGGPTFVSERLDCICASSTVNC
jgi:hypothetical protein